MKKHINYEDFAKLSQKAIDWINDGALGYLTNWKVFQIMTDQDREILKKYGYR